MRAKLSILIAVVLLSVCGGREQDAAGACEKAVKEKLAGRSYEMSVKNLAASAKGDDPSTLHLTTPLLFDKGLSSEYKQVLDCRVRFEQGKEPTVIFLQFNWATEDLKKD